MVRALSNYYWYSSTPMVLLLQAHAVSRHDPAPYNTRATPTQLFFVAVQVKQLCHLARHRVCRTGQSAHNTYRLVCRNGNLIRQMQSALVNLLSVLYDDEGSVLPRTSWTCAVEGKVVSLRPYFYLGRVYSG